jgi:AraC-like DNA-binding protein
LSPRKPDARLGFTNGEIRNVHDMGLTALELGLRGAASGVFLLMILVLLRLRSTNRNVMLGMAMSAGGVVYAIATAPVIPKSSLMWTLPILSAQPVVFWLWARAAFDDDFMLKRWHGALWLAIVGLGFATSLGWSSWPALAGAGAKLLAAAALVLALSATIQTVKTWSADLVARRRRLRIAILAINLAFIALVAGAGLASIPVAGLGASGNLASAVGLFVVAMLVGWQVFGVTATDPANNASAAIAPGDELRVANRNGPAPDIAPVLLRRLDHLMTVERVYRQEGLSIGALAVRLDLPEHRLRQAINEGLGYRNFNAFLNHYRIGDAKSGLSDPGQREVPVLTIAMDAGFQSIVPFNRAFKADTGMTPTEFRRDALARSQVAASEGDGHCKIGHSARKID